MLNTVEAVGERRGRERDETFQTIEIEDCGSIENGNSGHITVRTLDLPIHRVVMKGVLQFSTCLK